MRADKPSVPVEIATRTDFVGTYMMTDVERSTHTFYEVWQLQGNGTCHLQTVESGRTTSRSGPDVCGWNFDAANKILHLKIIGGGHHKLKIRGTTARFEGLGRWGNGKPAHTILTRQSGGAHR
jgi:hypothetical protein